MIYRTTGILGIWQTVIYQPVNHQKGTNASTGIFPIQPLVQYALIYLSNQSWSTKANFVSYKVWAPYKRRLVQEPDTLKQYYKCERNTVTHNCSNDQKNTYILFQPKTSWAITIESISRFTYKICYTSCIPCVPQ